jgi:hypothetical protein
VSPGRFVVGAVLLIGIHGPVWAVAQDKPSAEIIAFFDSQVRPLLAARCFKCHGKAPGKGSLLLSSQTGLSVGGDSGPVIVPGKPDESLLISAVRYQNGQLRMPPDGKLPEEDIARLERWVQEGAIWTADELPVAPGRLESELTAEQRNFWSFRPLDDAALPSVRADGWPQGPIDRWILSRLEQRGLAASEPADKRTLLRRATFDLTGLPPTRREIDAFLADESPGAFAAVVERLLASPHYGERWGRHWLDVVRYADARDLIQLPAESDFREAWRYRDWVISAFNRDLPYDQFIRLQLAGDLLQPTDPNQIDKEALVATGMLAIADFVPGDVDKEQMIADYVNDQIDVVGRGVMGLTLACARCHDHKFDPISTHDYYALAGIFFSTRLIPGPVPGNTPLVRVPLLSSVELKAVEARAASDKQRLAALSQAAQVAADSERLTYLGQWVGAQTPRYLLAAWDYLHRTAGEERSTVTEIATAGKLDEATFARWLKYVENHPHPALSPQLAAADRVERERSVQKLGPKLLAIARRRQTTNVEDPTAQILAESEILRFQADDPRIQTNDAGQVTVWPDHGGLSQDASPVSGTPGPTLAACSDHGQSRTVLRFDGHQMLQAPHGVPSVGSLFIVFRPAQQAPSGQRLIGWEDASVGQHGLGLMLEASGSLHAIVRRSGANGDIVTSPPLSTDFQLVSITWGPAGVTVHVNGVAMGTNQSVDGVSSAPDIPALHIGGPGSGASARFYCAQLDARARGRCEAELRQRWMAISGQAASPSDPLEDLYNELLSLRGPFWADQTERDRFLPEDARARLASMSQELEALKKKPALEIPRAVVVQEGGPPGTQHEGFRDAAVYIRGNPATHGPRVPRGFPRVLAGGNQAPIRQGSGRRELADWVTRTDHPLTARVMVNRIWQHHFGAGLVRTSTNFGARGERPSHPELLDYLARHFLASGWSVKSMHRLIMLSSVYQQSSRASQASLVADPENRLLGRMNRRRLEAEAIRDNLLAVAGRLNTNPGGPGFLDAVVPRRSVYLMSVRTGAKAAEFGPLFDGPDCSAIVEQRSQSTVAPQALFLLNDPFVMDMAGALAERVAQEVPSVGQEARIDRMYQIAIGRPPTAAEIEIARGLLGQQPDADAWSRFCHVVLCTNEFIYVD